MPDTAIGPHRCAQLGGRCGAFGDSRELRATHAGHHPRRTHRARTYTDFDDVRSRCHEVAGAGGGHDVSGDQRHPEIERLDCRQRVQHLRLMPVGGVDDEQVGAGFFQRPCLCRDVTVDTDRGGYPQSALGVQRR